jgi:ribosomal protein S18 acetylase RimI-like enzyme
LLATIAALGPAAPHVVRLSPESAWRARDGHEDIGSVKAFVRPDERCFVFFGSCRADAYEPLLTAVAEELGRDLYLTVEDADVEALRRYEQLGFVSNRRESHYLIPTDPDVTGLRDVIPALGFDLVSADQVDVGRLRALDDALRQDVPGTDGWPSDEAWFRRETFDALYDPATYLIATERVSGGYAGLARVWNNPKGPRLGMVAVLPAYRRRGLARAWLAQTLAVLHERGRTEVSTEIDVTNLASRSLLEPLGARRTGGSIELIRRRQRSSQAVA